MYGQESPPGARQAARQRARVAPSAGKIAPRVLHVASDLAMLPDCDHMLVYLNDLTWTRGEHGTEQLAKEVRQAMDAETHLIFAHEMIGAGQEERKPCRF